MTDSNYKRTILVKAPRRAVYDALTIGIAGWWTSQAGKFETVGDVAKFGFAGKHGYWTFKVTKLDCDRVEWECIDALHIHEGQPKEIETEWLGTRTTWMLADHGPGTSIRFEHHGLTPNLLCYEICEAGWDMFFFGSLKAYLDTGKGSPFTGD